MTKLAQSDRAQESMGECGDAQTREIAVKVLLMPTSTPISTTQRGVQAV